MALSTFSNISSQQLITTTKVTYYDFTFPTSLGNPAFSGNSYTYSSGSGSTAYLNGTYFMCSENNNTLSHSCYAMFLQGATFYMTGVLPSGNNYGYIYNASNNSITTTGSVTYSIAAYNISGTYYTTTSPQVVSTSYNGSQRSYGEYIQLIFPFSFIFQKLSLAVNTGTSFGPTQIRILGSSDNSTWTQITFITYTWGSVNTLTQICDLTSANSVAYKYHRIVWEKSGGGNVIILNNCVISGKAAI